MAGHPGGHVKDLKGKGTFKNREVGSGSGW